MTNYCIKPNKEEIKLDDCLACSGCITDDEYDKFAADKNSLNQFDTSTVFIISSYVKYNLFRASEYEEFDEFEKYLISWIKMKYSVKKVFDTSYFDKNENNLIESECPAVVLYVERVYPDLIKYLSTEKSRLQKCIEYVRSKSSDRIIVVSQCYDKNDEVIREKYESVHLVGSKDLYNVMKECKMIVKVGNIEKHEKSYRIENKNEINGLENVLRALNRFKKQKKEERLTLFICKNGCMGGPALIKTNVDGNNIESGEIPDRNSGKDELFKYSTGQRVFNKQKKTTFDIKW